MKFEHERGARYRIQRERFFAGIGGDFAWVNIQFYPLDFMIEKGWIAMKRKEPKIKFFHFSWRTDLVRIGASLGGISLYWWETR